MRERLLLRPGGEAHTITVFAREEWNESPAVYLEAAGLYRFEVVGEPIDWIDGDVTDTNGADGYEHLALKPFKRLARMPAARWFQLIGAVDRTELFAIGRACEHRPKNGGEFACFANDALFKYDNNRGQLSLSVRRLE